MAPQELSPDVVRRVAGARLATYTGAGAAALGGLAMGVTAALGHYDDDVPWYEKADYDADYLRRQRARLPLVVTGGALIGAGVGVVAGGALAEGLALRPVAHVRVGPGAASVALLGAGGGLLGAAFTVQDGYAGPPLLVGSAVVLGGGLSLAVVQLVLNGRAVRGLAPQTRQTVRRARVRVTLAPTVDAAEVGLAVAGTF